MIFALKHPIIVIRRHRRVRAEINRLKALQAWATQNNRRSASGPERWLLRMELPS